MPKSADSCSTAGSELVNYSAAIHRVEGQMHVNGLPLAGSQAASFGLRGF